MFRTRRLVGLFSMLLLTTTGLAAAAPAAHAADGTVTITVTAANRPVQSPDVVIHRWNGNSFQAVGDFQAVGGSVTATLPSGIYTAEASDTISGEVVLPAYFGDDAWSLPGFSSLPGTFVVADGASVNRTIVYPSMQEISGTVTVDGKPSNTPEVVIHRWSTYYSAWFPRGYARAVPDWKGRYSLPSLPDGDYLALLEVRTGPTTELRIAGTKTVVKEISDLPPAPGGPGAFRVRGADQVRNFDWNGTNPAPVALTPPSIPETATIGDELTVTPGVWTETPKLTYQWLRDGDAIEGATKSVYTPVAADGGRELSVAVTATQDGNLPGSATSNVALVSKATATVAVRSKARKRTVRIIVRADAHTPGGKVLVKAGKVRLGSAKVRNGKAAVTVSKKQLRKVLRGKLKGRVRLTVAYSGDTATLARTVRQKVRFL